MTSTIKVDNIQNQCGANIINESSNTITIGASGDTVSLASGASQSGFGRTGTVDWDTTAKTASFTAVSGNGYFVNTTSGAITVTLPASPSAGDIVAVADYANTADTNNITIGRNSSNIEGDASDFIINQEGASMTFVYVDATKGWIVVNAGNSSDGFVETFVCATGGTITTCGNCKIHTFTGPGTFTVNSAATAAANNVVSYLVVAAGGGGGQSNNGPSARTGGGGGGAGGFREYKSPVTPYTASPLNGNPGGTAVTVTAQAYPITIGGGSQGGNPGPSGQGSNSIFSTITSTGGGGGKGDEGGPERVGPGGSGGGASAETDGSAIPTGGTGNTPPVSPPQGNNGGGSPGSFGAGGGGASAAGGPNDGGAGVATSITGSSVTRAGGGGGGHPGGGGCGGAGGGGNGGGGCGSVGANGTTNTGGGGGGAGGGPGNTAGSTGGSGIVVIRYKFQ
jgi:hypothetical protein